MGGVLVVSWPRLCPTVWGTYPEHGSTGGLMLIGQSVRVTSQSSVRVSETIRPVSEYARKSTVEPRRIFEISEFQKQVFRLQSWGSVSPLQLRNFQIGETQTDAVLSYKLEDTS